MNFLELIEAKRDGHALSAEEIASIVADCTTGTIPDYQLAAFLMAVYFRGLDAAETTALTLRMRDSGAVLKWPADTRPVVDKHSTGGVGDKVSLPLAPLLACLGFRVPMISGRGLGITGGTLDKLESIPGFSVALTTDRIIELVQQIGCVICGQTDTMVPADKKLYALRDVTGTVPSIPLIVASILSKKLAESPSALVLDVKFGKAAFMPTLDRARELAQAMVTLATECGVATRALLTRMDAPLGRAAGNWLEVRESMLCLEGKGPPDLEELVLASAAHLLMLASKSERLESARSRARDCLLSGAPREKFRQMLAAQGARLEEFDRLLQRDTLARKLTRVCADRDGYVNGCDARLLGELIRDLGGGRLNKDTPLNLATGLDSLAKPGQLVRSGEPLAIVHHSGPIAPEVIRLRVLQAFTLGDAPVPHEPLIVEVVS